MFKYKANSRVNGNSWKKAAKEEGKMARKPNNSELVRIEKAEITIANSINNPDILSLVTPKGYPPTELSKGLDILAIAREKVKARPAAMGTQKGSTTARNKAEKDAMGAYQDLSTIAKAEFKNDPDLLAVIGLDKPMPRSVAEFIETGYRLIDNVTKNEAIRTRLAAHGYDEAMLKSERAKIEACDALNVAQKSAAGAKQVTSDEAQAAMKALDDWMSEYIQIAKVALKGKKNLMEKIGIKVRTVKTKAQRNAPRKAAVTRATKKPTTGK